MAADHYFAGIAEPAPEDDWLLDSDIFSVLEMRRRCGREAAYVELIRRRADARRTHEAEELVKANARKKREREEEEARRRGYTPYRPDAK